MPGEVALAPLPDDQRLKNSERARGEWLIGTKEIRQGRHPRQGVELAATVTAGETAKRCSASC
jgi:hypothetical protein